MFYFYISNSGNVDEHRKSYSRMISKHKVRNSFRKIFGTWYYSLQSLVAVAKNTTLMPIIVCIFIKLKYEQSSTGLIPARGALLTPLTGY